MPSRPRLPNDHIDIKNSKLRLWADEAIWGHRFYDDQTPWLVLLEFLNVFASRDRAGKALADDVGPGQHEQIKYDMPRLAAVRFLVFNNPYLQQIRDEAKSDNECWRLWLERMRGKLGAQDFGYLRHRFRSFNDLCRVVEFFQGTAVELQTNKRWTSRFLYPYGPDTLYADLDGKGPNLGSNDRRFFARGGELLYLMLNRSSRREEVARRVQERLLLETSPWNRLVTSLLPERYDASGDRLGGAAGIDIGYLPYLEHSIYDQLAEDWLALLALDLPGEAVLDPLVRLTGLNLILYIIDRGLAVEADGAEPKLVLEIVAPTRGHVFDLSKENFEANKELSARALRSYLARFWKTPEWQAACRRPDAAAAAKRYLQERLSWNPKNAGKQPSTPDQVKRDLLDDAETRHQQHFAKVLPAWSRQIGLSLARRRVGTWYAPNDALLKALVLANVTHHEEFQVFLARLFERYRIVVGQKEAERAYGRQATDYQDFDANKARLESRLRALGLLDRLSDDCAYVRNPFHGGSR